MFLKQPNIFQQLKHDFDLNGISEVYFWKSEWENFEPGDRAMNTASLKYIIYRTLYMLYFIGVLISTMNCRDELSIYFIYLTNLSFLTQTVYATMFFIDIILVRFYRQNEISLMVYSETKNHVPLLEKIIWGLINVVNTVPYIVTIVYWGFLYSSSFDQNADTCQVVNNYFVHASNSVLALIDLMIIAVPIKRTHVLFPVIFGFAYLIFTVLYEVAGGYYGVGKENIYPLIDWKNSPGNATIVGLAIQICGAILHFVLCWGLFRLRVYISQSSK